jgi:hypothetical protein
MMTMPAFRTPEDLVEAMRRGYDPRTIAEINEVSVSDVYAVRRLHMKMTGEFIHLRRGLSRKPRKLEMAAK